jgi:CheY-like chemotaxis protein
MANNELRHRARVVRELSDAHAIVNEGRLGQVILNLLINAAHAIEVGAVEENTVTVRARRAGAEVIIEIIDTGSGIDPAILPRLFDPFFTTKPVGVGTGLGLAICRSIVRAHGGNISVESVLGEGSTFRVTLPAAEQKRRPSVRSERSLEVAGLRILLVDDEPALLRAMTRLLRAHEVTTAVNGRQALDILRAESSFDLVMTDLMMPDVTGIELYETISAEQPHLSSRFVFLTGGAFTARAREFLTKVPNPRLEKPLDIDRFRALLADASRRRAAT